MKTFKNGMQSCRCKRKPDSRIVEKFLIYVVCIYRRFKCPVNVSHRYISFDYLMNGNERLRCVVDDTAAKNLRESCACRADTLKTIRLNNATRGISMLFY